MGLGCPPPHQHLGVTLVRGDLGRLGVTRELIKGLISLPKAGARVAPRHPSGCCEWQRGDGVPRVPHLALCATGPIQPPAQFGGCSWGGGGASGSVPVAAWLGRDVWMRPCRHRHPRRSGMLRCSAGRRSHRPPHPCHWGCHRGCHREPPGWAHRSPGPSSSLGKRCMGMGCPEVGTGGEGFGARPGSRGQPAAPGTHPAPGGRGQGTALRITNSPRG